jgi:hypothetical protein
MNNLPNESKNENYMNISLMNKNNHLQINNKSGISFKKEIDKEFSPSSSIER